MGNILNEDLRNRRVLLKKEVLKPEYHAEEFRIVKVLEGFGEEPNKIGRAIFVQFECDGEKARFNENDIEKIIE